MFSDDEDELELLRQYGEGNLSADSEHSSDEMDSDLEDKIMSMVQYGSGITKKVAAPAPEAEPGAQVVYAPVNNNEKSTTNGFSTAQELQIGSGDEDDEAEFYEAKSRLNSDDEDIGIVKTPSTAPAPEPPQVTRYINLDESRYMEDEETSEEETELGLKLQELIDEQIANRQRNIPHVHKPLRVCFTCYQPGHERKDCNLCYECGGSKHSDSRCVGVRYCGKCKMRGHNQADCPDYWNGAPCRICNTSYHSALNCPSLLHTYVNERPSTSRPVSYCYHCALRGHYGDECPHLPMYLSTMPSAFTSLSLSSGSRFDPKKTMKSSASSFGRHQQSSHQRFSDSSRESSPKRGYDHDRNYAGKKRKNYNDSDNEFNYNRNNNRYNDRYDDSDNSSYSGGKKGKNKAASYKDKNAGGKRRRTDLEDSRPSSLDKFFTLEKNNDTKKKGDDPSKYNNNGKSGNNNWKAMNKNSLPQPTRSGTVIVDQTSSKNNKGNGRQQQQQQQGYETDFPRGKPNLPKPSSSGVIDLTNSDNAGPSYSKRGPKYHGGYNRR